MQNILPLIARCLLSIIFLISGIKSITGFNDTVASLAAKNIALPEFFAAGAIAFLIAGSLSVISGYKGKVGAFLLLIFLVPATLLFHFNLHDTVQATQFVKNLGLAGGLLFIIAYGAGGWSMDARLKR